MDLTRDILLLGILIVLFLGTTPVGQEIVTPTTETTEKGLLSSIDKHSAGIDSNTDGISNLVTKSIFDNEDFAQDSSVDDLESYTDQLEQYTSGTETNTEKIQDNITSINKVQGENGRSVDSFDAAVSKGTNNLLNLPSHHPYSRERWRVSIDGDFKNLQYNNFPEYKKKTDFHQLAPSQGGNVTLEAAERPPYIVHYELWYSWAGEVNRSLETGDVVRIGAFDNDNGYFLKMNTTSGINQAYVMVRRNGTNTKAKLVDLEKPLTDLTRFELRSNWYNAGEQKWYQTSTDDSRKDLQENTLIGTTSPQGVRTDGPELPQLPLTFQVERGQSSSPISLNAGSSNILVAGETDAIKRAKTDYFTESISQAGEWEPVAAIRIQPEVDYIRAELTTVDFAESSADTDFFVTAQSHDPELVLTDSGESISTDGTGWQPPSPLDSGNTVLQFTTNVSQAADVNGSVVSTTSNPGGFQMGWGSLYSTGNKGGSQSSAQQEVKRPIYGEDVIVFWVKAEDEGNPTVPADATIEYVVEEDW